MSALDASRSWMFVCLFALALAVSIVACHQHQIPVQPSIGFTTLPPAAAGDGSVLVNIAGRVTGAHPGQQIVVFARSGMWWVQPFSDKPFTSIQPDDTWKNSIHPGSAYAALLVDPGYHPPSTARVLPRTGSGIRAVAVADGAMLNHQPAKTLRFSGYEWEVHQTPGTPTGSENVYDPANAWIDENGFLHLRIARRAGGWTSADVTLSRSLGYGSYRFVIRDVSHLEPSAVLVISTRDDSGPYREMDVELSRWGETASKNAQFVVQPYFVPANLVRFNAPAGTLAYSISWQPGRASFQTVRNPGASGKGKLVAAHAFTSGVPAPGSESVRLNFYVFHGERNPLQRGVEVVFEKFEYFP